MDTSDKDSAPKLDFPALAPMQEAAATYQARRSVYGPSEAKFGAVMAALFPDGLHLDTEAEFVRFGIFTQMLSKLCRYTHDFSTPHVDSVHDLGVYSFMLEAEDRRS